ncbi:MAG TPA: hypothetical protein VJ873_08060, partial [bacterium]|nr:hypothetical protein [bacterium]
NLQGVAKTIGDKLVRRHPHVFGKSSRRIADINRKWEELKRQEKPERKSALDGLPKSLPALLRAQRMHEKVGKHGSPSQSVASTKDLEKAWKNLVKKLKGAKGEKEKAAGEFLLTFTQYSQTAGIHAEMALRKASDQYEKKFRLSEHRLPKAR